MSEPGTTQDGMAELIRRIEWWRTDLVYKAPEMIGKSYAAEMIRDIHEMATGEQDD